ncbi:MAG: alpha/beta hydrolase [Cyanobacteria bacterium RM1_2_2]|nr:alpha/beta hydrolase [Cyanobacteria bacterium RM1_2_2]
MAAIQYSQGTFTGSDGTQRYEQFWRPASPKAAVAIVHGYAEHSGRYANFAVNLAQQNFAVYAFDLRGHGKSEGERGYVNSLNEFAADLEIFLRAVRQREADQPLFLLGHSMGGTIATLFTIQLQQSHSLLQGLILSGPLLKVGLAALLGYPLSVLSHFWPNLPTIRLDSTAISRDAAVVEGYQIDPLVYHGRLSAQTVTAILQATQQIQAQQQRISLSLLILHGTADRLATVAGSQLLYQQAQSPDKTLKCYTGLYHEVLNESAPQVLSDLTSWLTERLQLT